MPGPDRQSRGMTDLYLKYFAFAAPPLHLNRFLQYLCPLSIPWCPKTNISKKKTKTWGGEFGYWFFPMGVVAWKRKFFLGVKNDG